MFKNLIILAIVVAIGYFCWGYVEQEFIKLDSAKEQVKQESLQSQQDRANETENAIGRYR